MSKKLNAQILKHSGVLFLLFASLAATETTFGSSTELSVANDSLTNDVNAQAEGGPAKPIVISEVDLANNKIELVNSSTSTVDMTSWWLCNRVNGLPFYAQLSSNSTIDTENSTATSYNIGPGEILVLDLTLGFLPDANGELGIYNTNSFTSSSAIEDYILWGDNGIRDVVAQNAGIWIDDEPISVSGLDAGETIQLSAGEPGNAASEYVIGASTIGMVQTRNGEQQDSLCFAITAANGNAFTVCL